MANDCIHLIIEGMVQGVGFRYHTQIKARELGIKGWVKNRSDGSVEVIAEGPETVLYSFKDWCYKGPPYAEVTKITESSRVCRNEFDSFNIVF